MRLIPPPGPAKIRNLGTTHIGTPASKSKLFASSVGLNIVPRAVVGGGGTKIYDYEIDVPYGLRYILDHARQSMGNIESRQFIYRALMVCGELLARETGHNYPKSRIVAVRKTQEVSVPMVRSFGILPLGRIFQPEKHVVTLTEMEQRLLQLGVRSINGASITQYDEAGFIEGAIQVFAKIAASTTQGYQLFAVPDDQSPRIEIPVPTLPKP